MSRSQFLPNRLLLFVLLFAVIPIYGLYTDYVGLTVNSLFLGGLLFVWKRQWWWGPIKEYVESDVNSGR